jgi:hypothetical protein
VNHIALEQLQERATPAAAGLDLELLAGKWINTNPSPSLISRIHLEPAQGRLTMRVTCVEAGLPEDWGVAYAAPFAENPTAQAAMAFSTRFNLGGVESLLQGYVVKGVLVIVSFTRVQDARKRSSSFGKEFFYRVD